MKQKLVLIFLVISLAVGSAWAFKSLSPKTQPPQAQAQAANTGDTNSTGGEAIPQTNPPQTSTAPPGQTPLFTPNLNEANGAITIPSSVFQTARIKTPGQGALVKNPLVIQGQARVFEGVIKIVVQDGQTTIASKTVQTSAGAPNWGDFNVTLNIEEPKNPMGLVIVYTNSPKDGEAILQAVVPVRFK